MKTMYKKAAQAGRGPKLRKTFSLSRNALAYLEGIKRSRGAQSLTAALETLVQEQQQREALERLNQEISAYYDSLTQEEMEEQRAWAEGVARGLAGLDW